MHLYIFPVNPFEYVSHSLRFVYQFHIEVIDSIYVCVCVHSIPLSRIYNSGNKLPTTSFSVLRRSGRQQGEIKLSMTFVPKVGFFHPQLLYYSLKILHCGVYTLAYMMYNILHCYLSAIDHNVVHMLWPVLIILKNA